MLVCMLLLLISVAACTLVSSRTARPQAASSQAAPPGMTITVFEQTFASPSATRRAVIRTAAIASPVPSPTPRSHIVRENETLSEIALRYDLSLEELLAANPQVDPLVLQIGQQLIIPVEGQAGVSTTDTPPAPLVVQPPTCYSTAADGTLCLGIVENDQETPAERVSVRVQLLDAEDRPLGEQVAGLEQAYIAAGQTAPYRALFAEVPEQQVASVVVTLEGATLTDTIDRRFVVLDVREEQLQQDGPRYVFTAELYNGTTRTTAPPRAVVTLLDGSDQIYGYRVWQAENNLSPGGETQVRLSILPAAGGPLQPGYRLHVEARALD